MVLTVDAKSAPPCLITSLPLMTRNGNRSGLGRVFSYLDPTRGSRPAARLSNRFFSQGPDSSRWAPFSPTKFGSNSRPKSWPNQEKKKMQRDSQNPSQILWLETVTRTTKSKFQNCEPHIQSRSIY